MHIVRMADVCQEKRRLGCRLAWIGGFVFLVLAVAMAVKLWLIPATIKSKIKSNIENNWNCSVFVGPIRFSYNGQVQLEKITLHDSNKRQLLQAESINAILEKWPAELKTISLDINSLNIQIFLDNERLFAKERQTTNKFKKGSGAALEVDKLSIKNISAVLCGRQGEKVSYEGLKLSANRSGSLYNIKLEQIPEKRPESFLLQGTVSSESGVCDLKLDAYHRCKFDETALLANLFGFSSLYYNAEGILIADVNITGDSRQLHSLSTDGSIRIEEANIMRKEIVILENLFSDIKLKGSLYDITNIQADFCKGGLQSTLAIDCNDIDNISYFGGVSLKGINLAELTKAFETSRKFTKGTASAQYYFKGKGRDLKMLQGDGAIFMDNADLQTMPVIPYIFASIGLKEYDPLRVTDLAAAFSNNGSIVILNKAQIANKLSAVRVEPGGKIDLKSKEIEMHIVAALLKQIDDIAKDIPLVNMIARLKDKLVRLKLQGNWSDPPGKLITKEPLTDVREGTLSFLRDVRQSGGQITEQMYDYVKTLLKKHQNNELNRHNH